MAGSSSPSASLALHCPPARPIHSSRPSRAGLLVWPAEAERDPREPQRPATRDKSDSWDPTPSRAAASSPVVAWTLRPAPPGPRFSSSSSRRGRSRESRAAAPGESEPRPLPPRLGAGGGGGGGGGKCASLSGGEYFTSRQRLRLPVCVRAAAVGSGNRVASWPWRGDLDPRTPGAPLRLPGPLCRHLS